MKYCKKCLTTDLRPNSNFKEGVCIACRYSTDSSQQTSSIKLKILKEEIKKSTAGQKKTESYDCIVGVSGGKDSTRQAHWVRDRLGLRPLLVCVAYPPKQMSDIGAQNLSNLIEMGFDLIVTTPAPQTSSRLALESFRKFGNVNKSTEIALFSSVPRIAIEFGIKTIFWGENPALQVGDSAVLGKNAFDGNNLRNLNTLKEGGLDWILNSVNQSYKIEHYIYPETILFEKNNINIFYLGAAWDDWSTEDNACYAALQGLHLRPGEEENTGDISNASMLDEEFTNINMMLKYYKFGFGRATDYISEMIRKNRISRNIGIEIVKKFDGVCSDKIIEGFCEYVGIDPKEFWSEVNEKWVNKKIFTIEKGQRPKPKFTIGKDYGC